MNKYLIPSMELIRALYDEVVPLLQELKTKEDVIAFGNKHHVTMEINYDLADLYDENLPMEVIRCESWGDLDYIYVFKNGHEPIFDVWCDFADYDFIDSTTIENLKESFKYGIRHLWSIFKDKIEDLKEIVDILKQHGVGRNDMMEIYGFDAEIIEVVFNKQQ